MRTCGIFQVHEVTIPVKHWGDTITLVLFGDVHRDSPNHADGAWRTFLDHAKSLKNAWFLGLGDYLDGLSTSERHSLHLAQFHESTLNNLEDQAALCVSTLAKEIAFMQGRIIGLLGGNHYFSFQDGTSTDTRLCQKLHCKFLGVSAFIRLQFNVQGSHINFDIWAHHGKGASRLPGGSINSVDQMREYAEADLYIMGHDHKKMIVPATPRLRLDHHSRKGLDVKERSAWLARSGSFLTSYVPGVPNYNVDAARGPCSLGHVELSLTPRRLGTSPNREVVLEAHGTA
jgi:hypothetical protein